MNTKWTPGEWVPVLYPEIAQESGTPNDYDIAYNDMGDVLATAWDVGDKTEANAHLIAAAPDLYEALDKLNAAVVFGGATDKDILRAEKALAKARGES